MKLFPQIGSDDCGPACLATVLSNWKTGITLSAVKDGMPKTGQGATMMEMQRASRTLGLELSFRRSASHAMSELVPCICPFEGSHYVVVLNSTNTTIKVWDPARGICVIGGQMRKGFLELCDAVGILWASQPRLRSSFSDCWARIWNASSLPLIRAYYPVLQVYVAYMGLGFVAELGLCIIVLADLSEPRQQGAWCFVWTIVCALAAVLAIWVFVRIGRFDFVRRVEAQCAKEVEAYVNTVYSRSLYRDPYTTYRSFISNVLNIRRTGWIVAMEMGDFVATGAFFLAISSVWIWVDAGSASMLLPMVAGAWSLGHLNSRDEERRGRGAFFARNWIQQLNVGHDTADFRAKLPLREALHGVGALPSFSLMAGRGFKEAVYRNFSAFVFLSCFTTLIAWCLERVSSGNLSGARMLYVLLSAAFASSLAIRARRIFARIKVDDYALRIGSALSEENCDDEMRALRLRNTPVRLQALDLVAAPGGKTISFDLVAGESCLVRGANAAATTEWMRIFARVLAPASGDLAVNGHSFRSISEQEWRSESMVVFADSPFIPGTVKDNILRGLDENEEMLASILGFSGLERGILAKSCEGRGAVKLADSVKCRILIACALYSQRKFIGIDGLFDEADLVWGPERRRILKVIIAQSILICSSQKNATIDIFDKGVFISD